jgi:AraC family transcriptional regulator
MTDRGAATAIYETRHAANDTLATHRHHAAYAALVIEGSYVETCSDGPVHCTPGSLVLHPAFHLHGNRFGGRNARVLNLRLGHELGDHKTRVLRVADLRSARNIFARDPESFSALLIEASPGEMPQLPHWQRAFVAALSEGDESIGCIAARVDVSVAHASRAIGKSHGMSPQSLRREFRWQRALGLLGGTQSLASIAAQTGFADQSHFTRTTRAFTGMSPAALRQQIKSVQDSDLADMAKLR